jgi:hypothetical protein
MFGSKRLQYKIDAVRRLHLPYSDYDSCCGTCFNGCEDELSIICQECDTDYPCNTMKVIGNA